MENKEKKLLPGQRCDGYVHQKNNTGDIYREKWIHKDVVKKIGEGEDDFIIEQKPYRTERVNIQKEIDVAVNKCPSIKELVKQVMETGDETILVRSKGSYGDVTGMPTDLHDAIAIVNNAKAKGLDVGSDEILSMSKADLAKLVDEIATKRYNELKGQNVSEKLEDNNGGANNG